MDLAQSRPRTPAWFMIAAGLGLLWSLYGIYQYLNTVGADPAAFEAAGMTPDQAALMAGLPAWMAAVFAIGVFGGTIGAIGLLLKASWARPFLLASLAGYILLWIGDLLKGVFAAMGAPQIIILTFVVAVAAGLAWLDMTARRRGMIG
ncbi:hypothetical protein HKCCE3408_17495 [Rhodobacterales bacterium HKCCE3408]|nr:hypothetical protein [Rhodobacterales bacterium HKCCE3408]